jgi:hypothetical protein
MMTKTLIPLLAIGLASAACAPTPTPGEAGTRAERTCFNADQVQNFRAGRMGQLYVRALGGDVYELESSGGCTSLDFAQRLAILPDGAGLAGGRVCTLDSVRLAVPGTSSSTEVCRARVMRRLTEEEVAALPSRQRP